MLPLLLAFLTCKRGVVRFGGGCGRSSFCSFFSSKAAPPSHLLLRTVINQRPANKARNVASLHSNPQDDQEVTVTLDDEIRDPKKQLDEVEEDIKQITAAIPSKGEEISGVQVKIDRVDRRIDRVEVDTPRSFDLSSTWEWEHFFQDVEDIELHPSASALLELIPHDDDEGEEPTSLLMIGCGTSHLPSHISDRYPHCRLILMDPSQTCMNILKERYAENKQISFIDENFNHILCDEKVDFVYDLGLMDALLRGEEWQGEVSVLLQRISDVLSYCCGSYALVSYELPDSIKEFLMERGADVNLEWTFLPIEGIEGVEVSRATFWC